MCDIITSTEYRGYTIRQIRIRTAGGAISGPPQECQTTRVTPEYTQWQIVQDDKVVDTAISDDDARTKVDLLHESGAP